ncbi:MAG TPA: DUF5615 family PIN-like protein [Actinomycetes bacterium]
MRFFLDNDVDVVLASMLRRRGHTCWVAARAGLADAADDLIAIYAENLDAALVSHDRRFAKRRMRNTMGQHVWLACLQVDAIEVLSPVCVSLPKCEPWLPGEATGTTGPSGSMLAGRRSEALRP